MIGFQSSGELESTLKLSLGCCVVGSVAVEAAGNGWAREMRLGVI